MKKEELAEVGRWINSLPQGDARLEALGVILAECEFCRDCGYDQTYGTYCQCQNDE